MRIESLREFVELGHSLSYSKTAQRLFLSRATLAGHISELEKELGCRLVKGGSPVELTEAGAVFLSDAKDILSRFDDACEVTRVVARSKEPSSVRIAYNYAHPNIFAAFLAHTSVPLTFASNDISSSFFGSLVDGDVDIVINFDYSGNEALMQEAKRVGIECFSTGTHPLAFYTSKESSLAARVDSLCTEDFANQVMIVPAGIYHALMKDIILEVLGHPADLRFKPEIIRNAEDSLVLDLKNRWCPSLIEASVADNYLKSRSDLVRTDRLNGAKIASPQVAIHRKDESRPEVLRFLEDLRDLVAQYGSLTALATTS